FYLVVHIETVDPGSGHRLASIAVDQPSLRLAPVRQMIRLPQCAGMSLDEDDRSARVPRSSASSGASRPRADCLSETNPEPVSGRASRTMRGYKTVRRASVR